MKIHPRELPGVTAAEVAARMVRMARMVDGTVEHARMFDVPDSNATGRATVAVALWQTITGIEDTAAAMEYARWVATHEDEVVNREHAR